MAGSDVGLEVLGAWEAGESCSKECERELQQAAVVEVRS